MTVSNNLSPSAASNTALGRRFPAEWTPHRATWTAWPAAEIEWPKGLKAVRQEVAAMIKALATSEPVHVLATKEVEENAREVLGASAVIHIQAYGDIWLRDTGPLFCFLGETSQKEAETFQVNGWGGKYNLPDDKKVSAAVASFSGVLARFHDFILEGGSLDSDGEGTVLSTRQCLLNLNRNQGWNESKAEKALLHSLGVKKVIWLDEGLLNDHTDGHVDNIARFVGPQRVLCQSASGKDDPNQEVYKRIEAKLREEKDATGRPLQVLTLPSPGLVMSDDGDAMPASHMNFFIGNRVVLLPIYNERGQAAAEVLAKAFPTRKIIALSSRALLEGGGSFHCITQQEPL